MRKSKRHQFKYGDPEKVLPEEKNRAKNSSNKRVERANLQLSVPIFIQRDLLRTILTIGVFVIILIALYVIQVKTDLLKPVLKIFGL